MGHFAHRTRERVVIIVENYHKYYQKNLERALTLERHIWQVLMRDLRPKT